MSIKVMSYVWDHSKQQGTALLCLLALADYANEDGIAFPGMTALAKRCRIKDRKGLKRILEKLAEDGEIIVEVGAGMETRYGATNRYLIAGYRASINACDIPQGTGKRRGAKQRGVNQPGVTQPPVQGVTEPPLEGVNTPPQQGVTEPPNPSVLDPSSYPSIGIGGLDTDYEDIAPPPLPIIPAKSLVPHKPHFGTNGASSKPAHPPIKADSPHIDPRSFVNGYIPAGTGRNPVEVFYERHSIRDEKCRLNNRIEDDLARAVTDLDRWREVVTAWQQAGYNPGNVKGQLEWYRDGIPGRRRWQDSQAAQGGARASGAQSNAGPANGKPGSGDVSDSERRRQLELARVKITAQLVNGKIDEAEHDRQQATLSATFGVSSLQGTRALSPS